MNKKFSTLMALALLAGSFPVAAQYCPQDGEVPYRTRTVKAATLDSYFKNVNEFKEGYWYQLQVDPASLGIENTQVDQSAGDYVLTVERDYSTGKLYLTAKLITDATLTHSLWEVKTPGYEVSGRLFKFVNKETGYELSFDHYNALQRTGSSTIVFPAALEKKLAQNYYWNYEKDGLLDGCNYWWSWYTTEELASGNFGYRPLYSYYHNSDSVMALKAVIKAEDKLNTKVYGYTSSDSHDWGNQFDLHAVVEGLSENGLDGTGATGKGFAIVAIKESRANAGNLINQLKGEALRIKPVVAGAKVLTADEINTMIDADGSFMTFGNKIKNYEYWGDGSSWDEGQMKSRYTKFTVLKPGHPDEVLSIAEGANPFDYTFKAVESKYENLDRENWDEHGATISGGANKYAGYNVLFETKDPIKVAGSDELFGYLYVNEHNYEGTETGAYNGLQVNVEPYAYISSQQNTWGTDKAKRTVPLKYGATQYEYGTSTALTKKAPDPLEARYHWKVTYYATNDSIVLEPLNASRMNQAEMQQKLPFEQTHLARKSNGTGINAGDFVNTVNAAIAYISGNETTNGNSMYNKAIGVPVALYAMNNSQVGDNDWLLTVGAAANLAKGVNASEDKWAARCKFVDGGNNNPAYVTNKTKEDSYQSEMKLRLRFDNEYTPLQRATVETGLYYINLQSKKVGGNPNYTENREFGAYIVEDFKGHVVYDASQKEQDFSHMPATQWVVEQQPCDVKTAEGNVNYNVFPTVRIYNREFANKVFDGQLYKDENGNLFTINHRYYNMAALQQNVDSHYRNVLNCADTIAFEKVANPTTLGYFNANEDILRENVYRFQQMYNMNLDQFLGIQDLNAQMDTLKLLPETADGLSCEFELFRAEGWYPEMEYKEVIVNGEVKKEPKWTYKFNYSDSLKYGYPSEVAPQLYKTYYKVKLKDANLIDNDHRFLAIKNQHKYVIAREADIQNPANNLQFAIVSLKENNCLNGEHGYAIVNAERYTLINNASSDKLEGLYLTYVRDEYSNVYEVYFFKDAVSADKFKEFEESFDKRDIWTYAEAKTFGKVIRPLGMINDEDGNWDMTGYPDVLNHYNAEGKLLVEPITLEAKVSTSCETVSDVFALVQSNRPLYRTLDNELVLNDKKAIDIKTVDIQGNESLIEDSHSSQSKLYKMNYLGVENYGNPSKNEGFYVDFVQASKDSRMPQYMFVVAADSVPAYEYCDCGIDGHAQHGINSGCGHSENYAGYVDGRFLVNFNDSVKASIDKLIPGIDKFAFDNYTRLGFVEAVHRGDSLYVLKAPYTLESIKEEAKDGSGKYIIPTFLSKEKEGEVYDIVPLDGKHNNAVFALRNTEDDENSFLIESNDCFNNPETGKPMSIFSKVGSFAGAWIKIHNNVPVLAKVEDKNGNHNTGDATDSWLNMGDWVMGGTYGELINQAARFTFNTIDKDSQATANEEITAEGNVIVAGTNGAVVVKGAEGKNVIVSTILGKVVANEVVSSDNATIAAPQGVVVVSVDGESFKVVVK